MNNRLVIVGYGSIGRRHLNNLRSICPEAVIAVCRLSGNTNPQLPENADCLCLSLEELIAFNPVAAIIATPANTHQAICMRLAEAGIHLLIEKPLATSYQSALELSRGIDSFGVVAMVGYNLRFQAGLQVIKQAIANERLGRVLSARAAVGQYLPDWRPEQNYRDSVSAKPELGGGALLELSHELDYLLWLFGRPNEVVAAGGNSGSLDLQVEDIVELLLKYKSGPLISVHLDFLDRAGFRTLRIIGEEGSIVWDAIQDDVTLYSGKGPPEHLLVSSDNRDRNLCYIKELEHFLNCVESGQPTGIDVQAAADVVTLIDGARSSLRTGQPVAVRYQT